MQEEARGEGDRMSCGKECFIWLNQMKGLNKNGAVFMISGYLNKKWNTLDLVFITDLSIDLD